MMLFGERDLVSLGGFFEGLAHATLLVRQGGFTELEEDALASRFLGDSSANLLKLVAIEGKKGVGVEQVRTVAASLAMAAKRGGERRLVVVSDRFTFGLQAQNAFLKILEEPPEGVFFLLLAEGEESFLPTISSRSQIIKLNGPTEAEVASYLLGELGLSSETARMLFLQAGGSVAEILRLSGDEQARKKSLELLADAKRFLGQDSYGRLVTLNRYQAKSKRDEVVDFLKSLLVVLELASKKGPKEALRLGELVSRVETSLSNLKLNANSKVELLKLVG